MVTGALSDVRVIDLTTGIAGPFCTKLLADCGADVVKVEPPSGDSTRRLGPFKDDQPDPEKSGLFFFLNTNKRSVVLNLEDPGDRARLPDLVDSADMIVESFAPGTLAAWGLGYEALRAINPKVVLVSLSNFGQTGPYAQYKGTDLTLYAMGAEMHSVGLEDRPPIKQAGSSGLMQVGAMGAIAAMAGLTSARRHGIGQWVDSSAFETHLSSVDRRAASLIAYQFCGRIAKRRGEAGEGFPSGVYPCADGYIEIFAPLALWDRFVALLGNPPELLDPKWKRPSAPSDEALAEEFRTILYTWLFERTRAEIWEAAQKVRLTCAPLYTAEDVFDDPHFLERGVWADVEHPVLGTVRIPGRPMIWSGTPWAIRRPPPLLGEHTYEILDAASPTARAAEPAPAWTGDDPLPLPLEGIRILDLACAWAGQSATQYLADLGADVIKVENIHVWQSATRSVLAHPTRELLESLVPYAGGYPDFEPGEHPWNRCPGGVNLFRNKTAMTVDLRNEQGKAILARLVAMSDVVYENNVTETMDKLGVTYEWLRSINPAIIFVRAPAFGSTGVRKDVRAFGSQVEALIGHALLRWYPDLDPTKETGTFASDAFAGLLGTFTVLAALHARRTTGRAQLVELPQVECSLALFPEAIMDFSLNDRVQGPVGNRDVHGHAPQGVYRCAGADRWIAISVTNDDEWRSLRAAMGLADALGDPQFASEAGRLEHHNEIDAAIEAWTSGYPPEWLMTLLQSKGVPAGRVMDPLDCYDDPHLAARGFFETVEHRYTGTYPWPGMPFKMSATPLRIRKAPAGLGEHNEYVYKTLLGISDAEYAELEREGHIGDRFDNDIP